MSINCEVYFIKHDCIRVHLRIFPMLQKVEKHCREHREPGVLCPEMKMHQSKQIKQKKECPIKKV